MRSIRRSAAAALLLSVIAAFSVPATMMDCPDPMANTIQSLRDCVQHAGDMKHITDAGVLTSLLAKIDAAQAALDSGRPGTAALILQAFIYEVEAVAGQKIDAEHAEHMVMHAERVIEALGS